MGPKKAATASKKAAAPAAHPSYADMIKEAVISLKDRSGSSRQSIKKYVLANNNLTGVSDASFTSNLNRALQKGSDNGTFVRPKGPSGPVKLGVPSKDTDKPATKKAPAAKTKTAKPATAKAAPAKKAAAPKAATTKKAPAKKAAASATKTKSKANTSKVRKTATMAPAVEEKQPVALTKTKSGRVQKTTAPQPAKKAATKKATTKKAAAPKSAAK